MTAHILQLSDLHLFSDRQQRLRGVPPFDCLVDVLHHVEDTGLDPDLIVLSGDLAHDERRETYVLLRSLVESWSDRLAVIPGNHDQREYLREVFPEQLRGIACEGPFVTFARRLGDWILAGLDTHVPGEVPGWLDERQLAWLDRVLAQQNPARCLLFLHHPPVSVASSWLDALGLQQPQAFREFLHTHPQIAVVAAGHVHQEYTGDVEGRAFFTTPSTAMQFAPAQSEPTYDAVPCGYRVFRLDGLDWATHVVRLPELRFAPRRDV